jgi:DNA modification methylase
MKRAPRDGQKAAQLERRPIAKLIPFERNPRRMSDAALAGLKASIQNFGLVQPVVWNKRTGRVVGGHQRLKALAQLGHTHVDVLSVDLTPERELALNVALNNRHIEGEWSEELGPILKELEASAGAVFADLRFDALTADWAEIERLLDKGRPAVKEIEAPDPPKHPITRPGDCWFLGEHRVVCGDALDAPTVRQLVGKAKLAMVFTDPPWNVAIGQDSNPRHRQRAGLANDQMSGEQFQEFLHKAAEVLVPHLAGDLYCVLGASEWPTLDLCLRQAGFHWSATIIWSKDIFVLGRSKYHRRYEPIWYGWHLNGRSSYSGGRDQDDVWEIARPRVSEEHPTMKPVALVARAIENSSRRGDVVGDFFLGAGSTLLAAQQLGRRCYGMEIEPAFVDVTCRRWMELTGETPIRAKDQMPFSEAARK